MRFEFPDKPLREQIQLIAAGYAREGWARQLRKCDQYLCEIKPDLTGQAFTRFTTDMFPRLVEQAANSGFLVDQGQIHEAAFVEATMKRGYPLKRLFPTSRKNITCAVGLSARDVKRLTTVVDEIIARRPLIPYPGTETVAMLSPSYC